MKTENLIIAGKEKETSPAKWKNTAERADHGETAVVFCSAQEETCAPARTVWMDGTARFVELFKKAGMNAGQVTACAKTCMETAGAPLTNMEYVVLSLMMQICVAGDDFFSRLSTVSRMEYGQYMDLAKTVCRGKYDMLAAMDEEAEKCYLTVQKNLGILIPPEFKEEQTVNPMPGFILAYPSGYRYIFTGTLLAECLQRIHRTCPLSFTAPAHIKTCRMPAYTMAHGISACMVLPGIDFLEIYYGADGGTDLLRQCSRVLFCGEQMIRNKTADTLSALYSIPDLRELPDGNVYELKLPDRRKQLEGYTIKREGADKNADKQQPV